MEIVRIMRKSRIQQQRLIVVVVVCCLFLLKEEPCGVTSLLCSLPQCTAESSSDHLWTVQHSCNRRASSGGKIACTSQISAMITSYLSLVTHRKTKWCQYLWRTQVTEDWRSTKRPLSWATLCQHNVDTHVHPRNTHPFTIIWSVLPSTQSCFGILFLYDTHFYESF